MPASWEAKRRAEQGVAVRAAYQHARALERKEPLSSAPRHRGIRLSPEYGPLAVLPIIGRVAVENLEGYPEIHRLIGERSSLFVWRLKGDSMVDPQIDKGDDVIVRAQPWIEPGDVGGVVIDQEVTVKTILHRRTGLWLRPENLQQGYPPIRLRPQQRVRIVGKVIGIAMWREPQKRLERLPARHAGLHL